MTANDTQIGGTHYKGAKCPHCGESLEHWDLAWLFKWDNFQYAITKYVMRWRTKHGIEDLEKALHCLQKYIEVVAHDDEPEQEHGYEVMTKETEERANFLADAYDAANWGDDGAEVVGSLELRAFDNDGNEYTLMRTPRFGVRRDRPMFERPSPDLDASGHPSPSYVNQDPDLPLKRE